MTTDTSAIRALTFDCYGTLIDWHAGVSAAIAAMPSLEGIDAEKIVVEREDIDFALIQGPYLPYSEILRRSMREAAANYGCAPSDAELEGFAASMAAWKPFPESTACLERLASKFRLAILSNVERATLEASVSLLGVPFDLLVTAEELSSYKPARAHFDAALERLELGKEEVLHVAQSAIHDHRPAKALGWRTAWVNRLGEEAPSDIAPELVVPDLASLCAALGV